MKKLIYLIFFTMTLFSCQDTRSRKHQNKEQYPPQKLFEDEQLRAAQQIFNEDNAELETILKEKPEIINTLSRFNKYGYTLLMYASVLENIPAMEILLKNGADPNIIIPRRNMTPLSHAVGTNNYEMAKLLFKYKATANPAVGSSPLCAAMMLGGESTERKMIDFLLENGANINHVSYLGKNIMESAARSNLKTAKYLLEKGGNPRIEGTELSPMAVYIEYKENESLKRKKNNESYIKDLLEIKRKLKDEYKINFPTKEDKFSEAQLRIRLYENLNERDKRSVNFNENYGENRYEKDKKIINS